MTIVGYILAGPNTLPLQNCGYSHSDTSIAQEIKRLYIHPSGFGTGLSDSLLKQCIDWLRTKGHSSNIFLGVFSENFRALKFYERHHFKKIGEYGFVVGDHIDREFIYHLNDVSS